MALPSSGALSLSQIAAEFGDSAPYSLTDFYRGGANVPNAAPNLGVPTSGAISISSLYGAAAAVGATITATPQTKSNPTACAYTLKSDGTVTCPGITFIENWLSDTGDAANWEVYATFVSGTAGYGGTFGSWLALTSNRVWAPLGSGPRDSNIYTLVFDIKFRRSGGSETPNIRINLETT